MNQLEMIIFFAIIVLVTYIIWLIYKKTVRKNEGVREDGATSSTYVLKSDPNGQDKYLRSKNPNQSMKRVQSRSIEDVEKLSWNFLYEITMIVLKKFTQQDRALVVRLGKTLLNSGMIYNHVVNFEEISSNMKQLKSNNTKQQNEIAR